MSNIQAGAIFGFLDITTEQICLMSVGDGRLQIIRGDPQGSNTILATSTNILLINVWYYIELKVVFSNTVGTIELRVNGTSTGWVPPLGSLDTVHSANVSFSVFAWQGTGNATTIYLDDMYLGDGAAPATTFLGDRRVVTVVASAGDGTYGEFTPSTGTDNGAMVDEATPDGDTTYNGSVTLNHRDTYNFAALGVTGLVGAVEVNNWCKKSDAGVRSVTNMCRIGGADYVGTNATALSDASYLPVREIWETSPATAVAWTVAEIDGAEFGVKVTT